MTRVGNQEERMGPNWLPGFVEADSVIVVYIRQPQLLNVLQRDPILECSFWGGSPVHML